MMDMITQNTKSIIQLIIELLPKWITDLLPEYCIKWPLFGNPFFFMEILKVEEDLGGKKIIIETTGAKYELTRTSATLIRRIDPKTNSVNLKQVGVLSFKNDIGFLRVKSADKRTCIVESNYFTFQFNSDSLFFISPKNSIPLTYEYNNLIENSLWNKSGLNLYNVDNSEKISRMWTDGYGGSLHCCAEGPIAVTSATENSTLFTLGPAGKMAHMVFPPRFFDFEALYGKNAKPHVWFYYRELDNEDQYNQLPKKAKDQDSFGYIVFWHVQYDGPCKKTNIPVDINHRSAKVGYKFKQPDNTKKLINELHEFGFQVLVYMSVHHFVDDNPSMEATLQWMKDFQNEYKYDGYYFDYAGYGKLHKDNWYNTYKFIRRVREQLGDKGYIFHHNTVDTWGDYTGLRAIMVDTYCNAQLAGETAGETDIDNAIVNYPDEKYMRFFTSGYGLSQVFGTHKRLTKMMLALSYKEKQRLMGENLNGMERFGTEPNYKTSIYKKGYDLRKTAYLAGDFNPDVQWPPYWFKRITDVKINKISNDSFQITWTTEEPTDSEVVYTSTVWWETNKIESDGSIKKIKPDGCIKKPIMTKEHSIELDLLTERNEKKYQIRIRSSNKKDGLDERIWGYVCNLN